jgi:cytochrome P450/NADPH-cytochrome P450 reductase
MQSIPQPDTEPFFGNLRQLDKHARIQSMRDLAAKYGEIYQLDLKGVKVVVVSSQELVNELCDEKRFSKALSRSLRFVRDFAGDGLFTAENNEPNWAIAHRILMPTFGPKAIQDMFPQMLDIAEQLCLKWERLSSSTVIDIVDNMTRLTLDTIALCAFNYRFNSFYQVQMHPFVDAMFEALYESGQKSLKPKIVDKFMIKTNRRYRENIDTMHRIADELIQERKNHPNDVNDLLNRMLNGRDPVTGQGLNDENIRFQMVTFLIAGHETTSGALSFALHELVKNPHCLRRAQQEVDEVVGTDDINVKHISKLVYLDQVLKETMRLWPTAPAFALQCQKEEVIGGRYTIKPSDIVMVLTPALQRDQKVWGANSEQFNPDRMSPEKFASLPKNSFKAFGTGLRSCIGRAFAWQEALLVLAMILQRFDLIEHDPQYKLQIKEALTIKPDGLFLRMSTRSSWTNRKSKTAVTNNTSISTTTPTDEHHTTSATSDSNKNGKLLVLFGSNSGTCESFANTLSQDAQLKGYQVTVAHLNSYVGQLPIDTPTLILTASYEGQPTDDAKQFVSWLEQIPDNTFKGLKYAVLGCGHTDWIDTYQRIPILIDKKLVETGATRIIERGEANAAQDMFHDFEEWREKMWKALSADNVTTTVTTTAPTSALQVNIIKGRETLLRLQNLQPGEILENRELVPIEFQDDNGTCRSKRHIELRLPENMHYREGDYLAILPVNSMNVVNKALCHFCLNHDDQVLLQKNVVMTSYSLPTDKPISVVDLMMNYFELSQPASNRQLQALIDCNESETDRAKLQMIQELAKTDRTQIPTLLDLLDDFRTSQMSLAHFLEISVPMRARQYSISSSPLWAKDKCTITVGILHTPSKCGEGVHEGVASNFLTRCLPAMKVSMMVRSSSFKLPNDHSTPIIMIGAGTGIAPFRGFIQQRAILIQQGSNLGKALLFQGCRHPDQDYLYREEFEEWSKLGAVHLRPVFSRLETSSVRYVQHRLWECRTEVSELLLKDAHIYVCGEGSGMAPAVKKILVDIYREGTQCTQEEAERIMSSMDNRYSVDVFA